MKFTAIPLIFKQLFEKPVTNLFPAKYAPKSVHGLVAKVQAGKASLNPPVPTPPGFRGMVVYDGDSCIGCKICQCVCPANAIEVTKDAETKAVDFKLYTSRCVQCGLCIDACMKDSLKMSPEFLNATTDKYGEDMIQGTKEEPAKECAECELPAGQPHKSTPTGSDILPALKGGASNLEICG